MNAVIKKEEEEVKATASYDRWHHYILFLDLFFPDQGSGGVLSPLNL